MLKDLYTGFVLQVQFLTRFPLPLRVEFIGRAFARGVIFAPLIGLLIGAVSIGVYILTGFIGSRMLAVFCAVVAGIVSTGGLHLDGLADACDGLFSSRDRDGMLRIMKDSRIGTNGVVALIVLILGKLLLFSALSEKSMLACILIMPVLSRMTIAWSAGLSKYAGMSTGGPASGLIEHTGAVEIVLTTIVSLVPGVLVFKLKALSLAMVMIAYTLAVNLYAKRKIGGITGDVIGAVIETSEAVFLLAVLIMERI
jgi:adenosylcobinamide-GDP ribazoletransferase